MKDPRMGTAAVPKDLAQNVFRHILVPTLGGFPETEQDRAKEEASSLLDEAVAHAKRTFLEIDSRLRTGLDLRHEILNTAKEISADLLVLTTHKFAGWKNLLFGSDAEKILEHAQCPILILRF